MQVVEEVIFLDVLNGVVLGFEFDGVFVVVFIAVLVASAGCTVVVKLIDKIFPVVLVTVDRVSRSVFVFLATFGVVVLLVGVVVWSFVFVSGTCAVVFNDVVSVVIVITIVLVRAFVAVIIFISIVGMQDVEEAIVFDVGNFVFCRGVVG